MKAIEAFATHGGRLDIARRLFPRAPEPWLDLSTGINPVAYPFRSPSAEAWACLPDAKALEALEVAASCRYGATDRVSVVAAPGTQSLIQRLPVLCKGRDVRILGPTFNEFERVFRSFDRVVRVVPQAEALAGADVAILVNPNNPDGRQTPVEELLALSKRVGTLVVDEAFADALPSSLSLVPRLAGDRILVLRSFGKFYGLAGLRLGFAVLSRERADQLRALLGPWPVSGPALAIGRQALADDAWLASTCARLASDGARLMFLLRHVGASPVGGTPLFGLVAHPDAASLFGALAQAGILVRPFSDAPGWLRFGFPGTEENWARLQSALLAFR